MGAQVKFEGEEGIDQGGVKKEFFQIMTRRMFAPDFGGLREPGPALTCYPATSPFLRL